MVQRVKKPYLVLFLVVITSGLLLPSLGTILPPYYWTEDGIVVFNLTDVAKSNKLFVDQLYGSVLEHELPWYENSNIDLNDLRLKYGANRFVSAFRTTLPDPIFQEEHNVQMAISYLSGTIIQPQAVFSLNKAIGPRTKQRGFGNGPIYTSGTITTALGGGICKVATTMYNVAIYSDLPVIERHSHSMLVPYVPAGRDATILWGAKDLKFINNRNHDLIVWGELHDSTLYIALYGQYDPPLVEWYSEELNKTPTWTIRRRNSQLEPGETRLTEGAEGLTVKTWIYIDYPHRPLVQKYLGVDSYRPLPNYLEFGGN